MANISKIRILRGSHNLWVTMENSGHILNQGEIGYVLDKNQIVIGDGVSKYSELTKFVDSSFIELIDDKFDTNGNLKIDGGGA